MGFPHTPKNPTPTLTPKGLGCPNIFLNLRVDFQLPVLSIAQVEEPEYFIEPCMCKRGFFMPIFPR
jgi:hypothetical protein